MTRRKRVAAGLLAGGLALALGTPAYIAQAGLGVSGYLLHWELFLMQTVPYLLCAGLWLPWRTPGAERTALILAALLLLAATVLYVPMLINARSHGGDMIGLAFILISVVTTGALLVVSLAVFIIGWLRRSYHPEGWDRLRAAIAKRRESHR